ncbi:MAG TPA: hypothetical protein VIC57_01610 [Candidatus Dormibacteraeota bacterium]
MSRIVAAAFALQLVLVLAGARPAAAGTAGLPMTRLELGISSDATQLAAMKAMSVPWKYRYQYLAGGVNTSSSWLHWQDASAPAGQFAADYMAASGGAGYIPFFPYYNLLQSTPASGGDEASKDASNVNNAGTMNAYFSTFKVLMQRAHAYGKPVVVLNEPDFWGFMQQRGAASGTPAAVASSGFADVAGLPNTVAGFAAALLHLRDVYAPNVIMAVHASLWSSGTDIGTSTSASINAVAEADRTAAWLASTGHWDVVTTDVDDHDADWWVATGRVSAGFTHSWDASNARFPNFHRWEQWIGEIHSRMGLPAMAWQTPVGNSTLTNTCDQASGNGHYRDNVVQYFLAHPAELAAAGLVAVIFGAGNACQTSPYNDGGVLKQLAGAYYAGKPAVIGAAAATPAASATPSPSPSSSETPAAPTPEPTPSVLAARPAADRSGGSRMPLLAGGLAAFVLLGGAAASAVWWFRVRRRPRRPATSLPKP